MINLKTKSDSNHFSWQVSILYAVLPLLVLFGETSSSQASEKIGSEKYLRTESYAEEGKLEQEAYNSLIQEHEYQRLRGAERQARIDALKLLLQRKKRKRFSQTITYQNFYDTNYFNENRESQKGTIVFHVIPTTMIDLSGDRIKATLQYTPGIEVPARFNESKVKRYYQNAALNFEVPLGKRTFIREYYNLFRGLDRATSETTNFSLRTDNTINNEIEYFLNKKFSGAFEHSWKESHFTSRTADINDSREHWFLPRFSYYITPKTSLFVQGGGGKTIGGNGQLNATNWRLSIGVSGRITRKSAIFLNFGGMVKKLSEHPLYVTNHKGPFLELIYLYSAGRRFLPELKITAGSATENSFTSGVPLFQAQNFHIEPHFPITSRFSILSHAGIQSNVFGAEHSAPLTGDDNNVRPRRRDKLYSLGYGFQYKMRHNISIVLSHDFSLKVSNIHSSDLRQHVYKLSITLGF